MTPRTPEATPARAAGEDTVTPRTPETTPARAKRGKIRGEVQAAAGLDAPARAKRGKIR